MENDWIVVNVEGDSGGLTDLTQSFRWRPIGHSVKASIRQTFGIATAISYKIHNIFIY